MPSPSKKPRLHLRSRARDDVLLNRLLSEVRSHEKKVREELRRAVQYVKDRGEARGLLGTAASVLLNISIS